MGDKLDSSIAITRSDNWMSTYMKALHIIYFNSNRLILHLKHFYLEVV